MTIGLSEYRSPFALGQLLLLPFQGIAQQSFIQPQWRPEKMSPQELQALLGQEKSLLVLDVRHPDEFIGERGHIAGAVLCPLPELDTKISSLTAQRTDAIVIV